VCGEPNPYTVARCQRCGEYLAWAEVVEGKAPTVEDRPFSRWVTRVLAGWGWLPPHVLKCRYCERQIDVDTTQCPHCKVWLASSNSGQPVIAYLEEFGSDD